MKACFLGLFNYVASRIQYFFIYSPSIFILSPVELLAALERVACQRCPEHSATVAVGDRVLVWDLQNKVLLKLTLIASQHSNPKQGLLSVCSGLGMALLGKHPGSYCKVSVLHKEHHFRLLSILNFQDEKPLTNNGEKRFEDSIMPPRNLPQH
ncbi:GreA/GreB family elongation factor [Bowmanella yangjiangensis]|uniref:GreA/GreB family elongation factor n=1 Tax=Bowmanella yangjiangensis TaxID=2811230 RepID=A0ABS3CS61_9ALTE|nr:GreA/GreB family elongation factor [Bowmanella yangjiangensis]MBN7819957.1 GreA/GreB family elongation factor [Bowmanella yangjiangensis]